MTAKQSKHDLRQQTLRRRRTVGTAELEEAGQKLASVLADTITDMHEDDVGTTSEVAAYISMGTEIPTTPLLRLLLSHGVTTIVPRLGRGLDIGWSEVDDLSSLQQMPTTRSGALRPYEPSTPVAGPELLHRAALVILPALAVDLSGTRLGRGGGWYDRALLHRRGSARIMAVCWPWEISRDPLPHEAHDIPVDAVATPERLMWLQT